ncbi:MAG: M48 family metalloprotease [Phycisphaerales bacterium]
MGWMRNLVAFASSLGLAASVGCATNAATGKYQFNAMNRDEEIKTGEEAKPQLIKDYGGQMKSPQLNEYVAEVGMKLVNQVEDPEKRNLPWEFIVLDSDVINAFSLPGGKVFMSRSLMQEFDSEAELAGVLGHEIGHVAAEHAEQRMAEAQGVNWAATIGSAVVGAVGGSAAGTLSQATQVVVGGVGEGFLLKWGRDEESEADALGVRYMIKAGYDPQGLIDVMTVLQAAMQGEREAEFLSTHPYPETRLVRLKALLNKEYPGTLGSPKLTMGRESFAQRARPYLPPPGTKAPAK